MMHGNILNIGTYHFIFCMVIRKLAILTVRDYITLLFWRKYMQ
jgi:hypothetical protein